MTHHPRARRRTTALRLGAGGAVCFAVGTALAPGAEAAGFTDGQWYVAPFKLAQNHTVADGSGVTVAVIDGRYSPGAPSVKGADVVAPTSRECFDSHGSNAPTGTGVEANHGTEMTSMIVGQGGDNVPLGVAPGAKVLQYTVGFGTAEDPQALVCLAKPGDDAGDNDFQVADAIQDAVAKGARIINMSFGGKAAQGATQVAIMYGERKGVVFVAATDDNAKQGTRIDPPASFNGVVAVNAIDRNTQQASFSAKGPQDGPLVVASAPGVDLSLGAYTASGAWDPAQQVSGSSPAAAFVTGVLAATLSKWPKATGNQLIQSLARNTGGKEHDITPRAQDGYGYGTVSLTGMLAQDPTGYPDENPTLRDGALPTTADILQTGTSSPSPGTSSASSPPGTSGSSAPSGTGGSSAVAERPTGTGGSSTGLIIGIAVGVVVLLAVVALVIVLVTRRGRRGGPPPGAGPGPGGWPVTAGHPQP